MTTLPPPPPPIIMPPPVYGVTVSLFAMSESCSVTESVMFAPIIPIEAMATTPITIPRAARTDRRK